MHAVSLLKYYSICFNTKLKGEGEKTPFVSTFGKHFIKLVANKTRKLKIALSMKFCVKVRTPLLKVKELLKIL